MVVIGGGTGLSSILSGLKEYTSEITAIVAMSDDGGSSGVLRHEMDMVPPGDVRNCLVSLAECDDLLRGLFNYRFTEGALDGHSFGNLFLAALSRVTGDFESAVKATSQILKVRGKVLPSTARKVSLVAVHADGTKTTGETRISASGRPIERVELKPAADAVGAEIRTAIENADAVVLGPGSLYTSIIPNLVIDGMPDAIRATRARTIYVANITTQPGETDNFNVSDHLRALEKTIECGWEPDCVVVNSGKPPEEIVEKYREKNQDLVKLDDDAVARYGGRIVTSDVICRKNFLRHDPQRTAKVIMDAIENA